MSRQRSDMSWLFSKTFFRNLSFFFRFGESKRVLTNCCHCARSFKTSTAARKPKDECKKLTWCAAFLWPENVAEESTFPAFWFASCTLWNVNTCFQQKVSISTTVWLIFINKWNVHFSAFHKMTLYWGFTDPWTNLKLLIIPWIFLRLCFFGTARLWIKIDR